MDGTAIVITIIFALIVIGFLLVFRRRGKAEVKGPFNMGLNVEGSNEEDIVKGIRVEGAKSSDGGFQAEDSAGGHVSIKDLEVHQDIKVSRSDQGKKDAPKAHPPA